MKATAAAIENERKEFEQAMRNRQFIFLNRSSQPGSEHEYESIVAQNMAGLVDGSGVCMIVKSTLALCAAMHFYTLIDTGNPLSLLGLVCCAVSLGALYWPNCVIHKHHILTIKEQHHMKPFNIEHAKAGAPVRLSDGTETVRIIATDMRGNYPVVVVVSFTTHDALQRFDIGGAPLIAYGGNGEPTWQSNVQLKMAPLGQVEGRDVYMGDTLLSLPSRSEYVVGTSVLPPFEFTWPRKYPQTQMGVAELLAHHKNTVSMASMFESVANAAIAHGIQHGYLRQPVVMPTDEELMVAYYHPAPVMPMMPGSYATMAENLQRVWRTEGGKA